MTRRIPAAAAAVARSALAAVVSLGLLIGTAAAQPLSAAGGHRVLVMPFDNVTQDGKIVWLSEAAAVLVADDLNAMGLQAITREERQEAFDRLRVPRVAALTEATVLRLGQLVGATSVVVGTVRMDGDLLALEARHIVLDSARVRQRGSERGPLNELFETFERLARQLVPPDVRRTAGGAPAHPSIAAFESYIKGLLAELPDTAATYLQAALDADPSYDRARLALWEANTLRGDHQAAAEAVDAVRASSPLGYRARFRYGLSLVALQHYDEAFEVYTRLADTHPTAAVFNNLGVIQLRRGGVAPGGLPTTWLQKATEADPADSALFFNLGYAFWTVRDSGSTIRWLREAVRRNPGDGEAHYVLGTALALAGDAVEGAREKELARRLSSTFADWDKRPSSEPVPKGLERLMDDVVLPAAARRIDDLQTDARQQGELVSFYVDRARRFIEQGLDRDAGRDLNRALFLSPYHADANLLLGGIRQRAGRLAEAIGSYKVAIWSTDSAAAHAALASAYLEAKDDESARNEAARALALDPSSAAAKAVLDSLASSGR
ncbi:MAG: tetratricopeptide repeat protein [Vicinamibacterales bacterium]